MKKSVKGFDLSSISDRYLKAVKDKELEAKVTKVTHKLVIERCEMKNEPTKPDDIETSFEQYGLREAVVLSLVIEDLVFFSRNLSDHEIKNSIQKIRDRYTYVGIALDMTFGDLNDSSSSSLGDRIKTYKANGGYLNDELRELLGLDR